MPCWRAVLCPHTLTILPAPLSSRCPAWPQVPIHCLPHTSSMRCCKPCYPQRKVPHVLSLTDFMGWRFGWAAKTYVVMLCLFNMSIGELRERAVRGPGAFRSQ